MRGKSSFDQKFTSYLQGKISIDKNEELFNGQFSDRTSQQQKVQSSVFPFSNLTLQEGCKFNRKGLQNDYKDSEESLYLQDYKFKEAKESQPLSEDVPVKRKRLKKLRQLEQNQCAVCLQQIKKKCQLKCKHKFCFDCIQNWFETSHLCPLCRAQIHSFWYKGEEFVVEPKEPDFSSDLSEELEETLDGQCYNCENTRVGDIVLICDRCETNACHIQCDPSLRGILPEGEWFCHFCRQN